MKGRLYNNARSDEYSSCWLLMLTVLKHLDRRLKLIKLLLLSINKRQDRALFGFRVQIHWVIRSVIPNAT